MSVNSIYNHLIIFCRQLRHCYFHTLFTIAFYPNFSHRMQMTPSFTKHMYMTAVVIYICRY